MNGSLKNLEPLWTRSAIEMVEPLLHKDMKVFEFGSGSSTIWFAERVKEVITLESSPEWTRIVNEWIKERNITNVTAHLRDITKGEYMSPILAGREAEFDLILVDGAFRRVESFERAIPKLKMNGYLLIDDSQTYSWSGVFNIPSVKVYQESIPDKTGKKLSIFRRL